MGVVVVLLGAVGRSVALWDRVRLGMACRGVLVRHRIRGLRNAVLDELVLTVFRRLHFSLSCRWLRIVYNISINILDDDEMSKFNGSEAGSAMV